MKLRCCRCGCLVCWFEIKVLCVGFGEEKVSEEGCVEQGLEDRIDVAGVPDVVQTCEVRGDFISLQRICVFEMHFQSMKAIVIN